MRRYKSRRFASSVDKPSAPNIQARPVRGYQWPIENVSCAVRGFFGVHDLVLSGVPQQSSFEVLPVARVKPEAQKKCSLAAPRTVRGIQKIKGYLSFWHAGQFCIGQIHALASCPECTLKVENTDC